ncbi:MAG: hypothetical protein SCARUB_05028 [Candidatus Scalindua rubra]|uniref:Uncharacterized protein n=1 Tax=Candidatus Scalindua rubra TaxID=1872076 RepID=A0A1E3X2Q5_9BACT|nr:MAG: hypothetical protein SCARUB_05028 [Candidatus Scalindua rubra]
MVNVKKGVSALAFTLMDLPLIPLAMLITAQRAAGNVIIESVKGGIKGGLKTGIAIQEAAKDLYNEAKAEYEEEKKEAKSKD